jgi:hypothetical protein
MVEFNLAKLLLHSMNLSPQEHRIQHVILDADTSTNNLIH